MGPILRMKITNNFKIYGIMTIKNLVDYYPVYMDFSELRNSDVSGHLPEYPLHSHLPAQDNQITESAIPESPAILNTEELAGLALKYCFTSFQTILLLLKNTFEGYVYLTFQIRPDQLFNLGTILLQTKPEILMPGFYRHFEEYRPDLSRIWKLIREREENLDEIRFDLLVHSMIISNLIRFPVSIFSSVNIWSFTKSLKMNQQAMDLRFELVLSGESALGEFELIKNVNTLYAEKFKELMKQLSVKEDMFTYYKRKLAMSLVTDIRTEADLDDLLYRKLVEEKLAGNTQELQKFRAGALLNFETSNCKMRIAEKTKVLYRSVSKNCSEVHSVEDSENSYPELYNAFLNANALYLEPVSNLSEAYLQYMRMLLLLSEVIIFRKTRRLAIADSSPLIPYAGGNEVISKDNLKSFRKNMDALLSEFRIKSLTDYKLKFIVNDDLTDIHKHFLQKHIVFIDKQIIQVIDDIRAVLKSKSKSTILKTSKEQEN
jgi:hypothetical protein